MRPFRALSDLLFPTRAICVCCGSKAGLEREWVCEPCRRMLARNWIGAFTEHRMDGMAVAYRYAGPAGGMVRALKYRSVTGLAEMMASDMLRAYEQIQPTGAEVVCAVPMHKKRLRRRGFNQSELLARQIAKALNLPYEPLLVRTRNTSQQARLHGAARRQNLSGAFAANPAAAGRRVLLIDDVYTTGQTAHQCERALRDAGAKQVYLLVFAKGNS